MPTEILFSEYQLRVALLAASRIHDESYKCVEPGRFGEASGGGDYYEKSIEDATIEACALHGLPPTLAIFLSLSANWDVQSWARGEYDDPQNYVNLDNPEFAKEEV